VIVQFLQRGPDVISERGSQIGSGRDDPAEPGHRDDRAAGAEKTGRSPDGQAAAGAVIINDRRSGGTIVTEYELGDPVPSDATPRR
jgi:hypothetical protein